MDNSAEYEHREAAEGQPENESLDYEQRHVQNVKLTLVVMQRNVGRPLDTDIYYGNRLVAERGQPITEGLVARLRRLKAGHLKFANEEPRLLDIN